MSVHFDQVLNTGREFENEYRSESDAEAREAAYAAARNIGFVRSPRAYQVSPGVWRVHYWSVD